MFWEKKGRSLTFHEGIGGVANFRTQKIDVDHHYGGSFSTRMKGEGAGRKGRKRKKFACQRVVTNSGGKQKKGVCSDFVFTVGGEKRQETYLFRRGPIPSLRKGEKGGSCVHGKRKKEPDAFPRDAQVISPGKRREGKGERPTQEKMPQNLQRYGRKKKTGCLLLRGRGGEISRSALRGRRLEGEKGGRGDSYTKGRRWLSKRRFPPETGMTSFFEKSLAEEAEVSLRRGRKEWEYPS